MGNQEDMGEDTMLKAIFWLMVSVLLVDLYWIPELQGYWWHWLGLIGYVLMGWFYMRAFD